MVVHLLLLKFSMVTYLSRAMGNLESIDGQRSSKLDRFGEIAYNFYMFWESWIEGLQNNLPQYYVPMLACFVTTLVIYAGLNEPSAVM